MIRRISTKWVLATLAAVVVPFVGFAVFVDTKVTDRMAGDVVRFHLLSLAADLADRIDEEIDERRQDVAHLSSQPLVNWFVQDEEDSRSYFRGSVERVFDGLAGTGVYDYVLAIDRAGEAVGSNLHWRDGEPLPPELLEWLRERDWSENEWFSRALEEGRATIDFHRLELGLGEGRLAGGWYVGFAHRIDPQPGQEGPVGVVIALMRWEPIQAAVSSFGVRQLGEGGEHPVGEDIYASSYAWIWKSDADTIIAHPIRDLYGTKVSELEGGALRSLVETARGARWGMYPDYVFQGVNKRAAFRHCKSPEEGGFGWIVGVGADDADIYAPVRELSNWLFTASSLILGVAILFTLFIAHRTTRPIRALEQHTGRIASGDLDARIEVRSRDELGQLAESFNRMTTELKENRAQLVRAEKEAAWREMARQVAHEIKNPLTPISLSADLLRRARKENSPEFDSILERTIDMIQRQVDNMREVARDFYAFAGEHKDPKPVVVGRVLEAVLDLNVALAADRKIRLHPVRHEGDAKLANVRGDAREMQRALLNLVSNAVEAMPEGGDLCASVRATDREVVIEIRDTGTGVPEDVRDHLFEPYFTTRSSGTGLGLAIVRRIVEDMGGSVEIENAQDGPGAVARVVLPRDPGDVQSARP